MLWLCCGSEVWACAGCGLEIVGYGVICVFWMLWLVAVGVCCCFWPLVIFVLDVMGRCGRSALGRMSGDRACAP